MNTVNGWSKIELTRYAKNIVNLHKQISLNPVSMTQAKRALLSINYHDINNTFWHDIARIAIQKG